MPEFDQLPFNTRPDLTPYLVHLTKNTLADDEFSAYDNLVNILKKGEIWGSIKKIKGTHKATCFMDVPFASFKYVLTPDNTDPQKPRYEPYGIVVPKQYAYRHKCRPVLYLSNSEIKKLEIAETDLWRVVKFEENNGNWISWMHEREWRCEGNFKLPRSIPAVFVRDTKAAQKLTKALYSDSEEFKCIPKSVIPFNVICQGLLKK